MSNNQNLSAISSMNSGVGQIYGRHPRHRPDASSLANDLFANIDKTGKGYIEKSDLTTAFQNALAGSSNASNSTDKLFAKLDADSDGKITKQEMTDGIKNLMATLEGQVHHRRTDQAMGSQPSPVPNADSGFTKQELQSQLDKIGSQDSTRSNFISNIVQNFDKADTNGDGKISLKEALAFDKTSTSTTGNTTAGTGSTTAGATAGSGSAAVSDEQLMKQVLKLAHAYGVNNHHLQLASAPATAS